MIKILFGVCIAWFVVSYETELKRFLVEIGMRDELVTYLQTF